MRRDRPGIRGEIGIDIRACGAGMAPSLSTLTIAIARPRPAERRRNHGRGLVGSPVGLQLARGRQQVEVGSGAEGWSLQRPAHIQRPATRAGLEWQPYCRTVGTAGQTEKRAAGEVGDEFTRMQLGGGQPAERDGGAADATTHGLRASWQRQPNNKANCKG